MTNGHAPASPAETEQVVLQMPPAAARRLRSVARTLSYILTALLSSGATRACSVREEPAKVSAAAPSASKCSPPCPPGQTCRGGTCYAVATEEKTAAGECLPVVEIIFRTRQ